VLSDGKRSVAERIVYGAFEGAREERQRPGHTLKRAGQRQAGPRGQEPSRRWRHLPGARRGQARTVDHAGLRWLVSYSQQRREKPRPSGCRTSCSTPATAWVPASSDVRTPTRWPSRTRRSPTTAGELPGRWVSPNRRWPSRTTINAFHRHRQRERRQS
jgi:hypothetical protein